MKHFKLTLLFFAAIIVIYGCSTAQIGKKETISSEKSVKSTIMDTIDLNPLVNRVYKVKVGDVISYSSSEHPSVGSTFDYDISTDDETISGQKTLVFLEKKRVYKNEEMNNPNPNAPVMTGADESIVTLFFKVAEKGSSKLKVTAYFRGTVTNTFEFDIIAE